MTEAHRTGFIAIVGRPNVGKSTLMNRLVGQKVSITSRKAQTTRHRIHGIYSEPDAQFVFVDTPGFQTRHGGALNRLLNRTVTDALAGVDAILLVVEALRLGPADRAVAALLPEAPPTLLLVNKIDAVKERARLLPFLAEAAGLHPFHAVIPVSARHGTQMAHILAAVRPLLPEAPPMFGEEDFTDRSARFLAAEFVREKVFRLVGDELPYATSVVIEQYVEEGRLTRIHAMIVVAKATHKAMVIGKGGEKLKQIGTEARLDLERLLGTKVFLELFVKVRGGWADDPVVLRELGYE